MAREMEFKQTLNRLVRERAMISVFLDNGTTLSGQFAFLGKDYMMLKTKNADLYIPLDKMCGLAQQPQQQSQPA